ELIDSQRERINALESELMQREAQLEAAMETKGDSDSNTMTAMLSVDPLFPPNPEPGHCYARVLIPATYTTESETVLVSEESERVEIIPARYQTVQETVLVKEASSRLEVVPAVYETVTERVLVKGESTRIEEVPATYRTVSEQVLISPARTEWKRGPASAFSASVVDSRTTDTGEIMCLVEVPAKYETVTRRVVDQAATTREVVIPAEYRTIEKRVLVSPATTREVSIPAEYDTVTVTQLADAASERRIPIPAQYETVTRRVKVTEEGLQWREVVCEVNLNSTNVAALQRELQDAGRYNGPIDGIIGPMTLTAANSYARSEGLPVGTNYIAMEVIEDLNLNF
ncbi:MAG: peptidoglycan-binding domain-containing protein, partial [Pseudomonadota bacterium]